MYRLIFGIPGWLLYFILMTTLMLLGVPLIALAIHYQAYRDQKDDGFVRTHWVNSWMWLWDNDEDGIDGDAISSTGGWKNLDWIKATNRWSVAKRIFIWSAWRNSVGNARWTRLFGMTVDPRQVHVWYPTEEMNLKLGPYLVRQGWRYELRFPWGSSKCFFWMGWRIAQQTQKTEAVGFAFQPFGKL